MDFRGAATFAGPGRCARKPHRSCSIAGRDACHVMYFLYFSVFWMIFIMQRCH
ncbi:hypothetical protein [Roseovarius salinarum]|uniref:hypothetical protein n=1 Tax=Roseovarius salinarum TaxID=1981892 RepID=UPI001E610A7B|nr:hypothetical protein [Roseovarius salinarum]